MDQLLTHLATWPEDGRFQAHTYQKISGGANNILYKIVGEDGTFAVKFTLRDDRRRAWREFQALTVLQTHGLAIAAKPILLDESSYAQPVVVQEWLDGEVTAVPPQTDAAWRQLVAHYATLAKITPHHTGIEMEMAVINFNSVASGLNAIQQQCALVPPDAQPEALEPLLQAARRLPLDGPPAPLALCRVDANTLNFIRRPDVWASVDWENSGWGDPAFEIADLMTHPQYMAVSADWWDWVMNLYAELCGDDTAVTRIHAYYPLMLIWWVARLARALYEIPRGQDERLAPRDPDWQQQGEQKLAYYIQRAFSAIN